MPRKRRQYTEPGEYAITDVSIWRERRFVWRWDVKFHATYCGLKAEVEGGGTCRFAWLAKLYAWAAEGMYRRRAEDLLLDADTTPGGEHEQRGPDGPGRE